MKKRDVFQNNFKAPKNLTLKIKKYNQYVYILLYYIVIEIVTFFQPHKAYAIFCIFLYYAQHFIRGGFTHETLSQCNLRNSR